MPGDLIFQFGYLGLFIISYLSATLIPFASSAVVIPMPALGYNVWLVILIATLGNVLGAVTNYYVGRKGSDFVLARYITIKPETWRRAERLHRRWGIYALFFSWLPLIGDALTVVAGAFQTNMRVFLFWVTLGRFLRYVAILGVSQQIFKLL